MEEFLVSIAVVMGLPFLLLGLLEVFAPESAFRKSVGRGLTQFKLWQLAVALAIAGLLVAALTSHAPGFPLSLIGLIVLALLLRAWRNEFVFLMGRPDDDFPGRNDKLIWVIVLLFFAPVGLWFFRSYRMAHWPEPKPQADFDADAIPTGSRVPEPS
jgi:hypothetical protein